jgi:NADH:ubiquinone oxidoreductase subunit E
MTATNPPAATFAAWAEDAGREWMGPDGRWRAGASFLLALAAQARGGLEERETQEGLQGLFGLAEVEVRDLIAFAAAVRAAPGELKRCQGVNCTLRGGPVFHDRVQRALAGDGPGAPGTAVFCLGQCDAGPSLRHGRYVYCGTTQRVLRDDRSWRRGPALEVEIEPSSPRFAGT